MDYKSILSVNAEIKKTAIKGNLYAEVPQKVKAFRKLEEGGTLESELLFDNGEECVFKVSTYDSNGILLGTGHAYESVKSSTINQTSYIENCETSAVGRSLMMLALGLETKEGADTLDGVNALIKTTDIKGKNYAEVSERIVAFRMLHPEGSIQTQLIDFNESVCKFRACVYDKEGRLLASGTAFERRGSSFINKSNFIENCETSAVGRALGMAGFGIDVSIASYDEVQTAIANQSTTTKATKTKKSEKVEDHVMVSACKYAGKTIGEIYESDIEFLKNCVKHKDNPKVKDDIKFILELMEKKGA